MTEHKPIGWLKGHVERANSGVTEAEARNSRVDNLVSMIEVIARGAAQAARASKHKGCTHCGTAPLPAKKVQNRWLVTCEDPDCKIEINAYGASPEEAFAIWDARI